MIHSRIFHRVLNFLQKKHFWEKKIVFEDVNSSANNIISVQEAQVLGYLWINSHMPSFVLGTIETMFFQFVV
jgi:hypothetical protein